MGPFDGSKTMLHRYQEPPMGLIKQMTALIRSRVGQIG